MLYVINTRICKPFLVGKLDVIVLKILIRKGKIGGKKAQNVLFTLKTTNLKGNLAFCFI